MSDDILSGGRIDKSTDGPNPSNVDDRSRNILQEQKAQQDQDGIGGTQFPPRVVPLPPIPVAPEVAPPLPVIPSFDFSVNQSVTEQTREIARQATIDVIKNVTINGQGPSIDGSSISFNFSQSAPASEIFSFQGIVEVRPQPISANNITDISIAPPASAPEPSPQAPQTPQATQSPQTPQAPQEPQAPQSPQATEAPQAPQVPQVPQSPQATETPQTPQTPQEPQAPQSPQATEAPQTPQSPQATQAPQATETRGVDSENFGTGGNENFGQSAYTNLSDYTTFGKPSQETQERPSRLDDPDFGSGKPLYQSPPSSLDDPDFGTSDMDETDDTYQKAQAAYRAKRESHPDFDRESSVRQKFERHSEFKERQEALKEERAERLKLAEEKATFLKRAKEGSIGETPSGMVPVAITRADGARKILAYFASEFVGVVEGAKAGERVTSLPSEDSYYEAGGGGGGGCIGLALYTKTVGTGQSTSTQVWISAGTVAGDLPSGFDPLEGHSIAGGGSGEVWARVNINGTTGDISSVEVSSSGSTPSNTGTSSYYPLGYYEYDGETPAVANYGCGSVSVAICRNWFATSSPFYTVTFLNRG